MNEHLAELHPGEGVGVGVGVLRSVSVGECKCITFSHNLRGRISNYQGGRSLAFSFMQAVILIVLIVDTSLQVLLCMQFSYPLTGAIDLII